MLELAELVWREVNGDRPFRHTSDAPFEYDVQRRIPDTVKAARVLGFSAEIPIRGECPRSGRLGPRRTERWPPVREQ